MKLLVARLGSKVFLQDHAVLDDFFTSFQKGCIPGEAPRWIQEKSKTLIIL
jgi:hypothetical protein